MANHRFVLRREWNVQRRGIVNFIMLNPSTADDVFDDPTIRRCVGFAKRWGFSGLAVTNLFAFRATDPRELKQLAAKYPSDAIGPDNDWHLQYVAKTSDAVVCAWGNHGDLLSRNYLTLELLSNYDLFCIRRTGLGNPAHPVREPYTDVPILYFPKKLGTANEELKAP